ncbi:FAD binding domain-containing protein [Cladophialophora immunda]|nr:FAD binding domain-containing protein [Cladophialophora immunda]
MAAPALLMMKYISGHKDSLSPEYLPSELTELNPAIKDGTWYRDLGNESSASFRHVQSGPSMAPPIAILGAGPSGLTLGRMLELANIDYIIFERDVSGNETSSRAGTLDIHADSGQMALREAGLLDEFKKVARGDAHTVLADGHGKVYVRTGASDEVNEDRPEIDRKDLRALLLTSVPANKVRWGMKVQQVQQDTESSMSVRFADGSIESGFRLVVGADGAWSKARSLVTSAKPQYSGLHYLTTTISPGNPFHPSAASLAGQGNYIAFGEGKQIVALKLGDGSYYVGVGLRLPEGWSSENAGVLENPSALCQLLQNDHFAGWPQLHMDLIKHGDGRFYAWPLYAMPTESLPWRTVYGVTLVGDAAHLSTPFVGEGVNCAMTDSLQLAQQIVKHGLDDLGGAVSEYERLMVPRAIDLITRSTKSGELFFAPDAPRGWLKTYAGIDID